MAQFGGPDWACGPPVDNHWYRANNTFPVRFPPFFFTNEENQIVNKQRGDPDEIKW